ncbi:hypothetical protein L0B53_14655 [Vibrio sp. SS-MA-C1-2]|uniref:hypothetical protein n=1 Tax=Vibrio sp. SS-MA-C1-2 TaxID=2908646 RepID=UPI001F338CD2|nr:hypothetical protein [Vibrio sp. SS-MA-C1-2]UJF18249.1 hypothetical protein L0B53_14655 [Vibrio sp. SS-MA-C1-2]
MNNTTTMNNTAINEINIDDAKVNSVISATVEFTKEALSLLALFAFAAVPTFFIALQWAR